MKWPKKKIKLKTGNTYLKSCFAEIRKINFD